jgi:hypothetical protein
MLRDKGLILLFFLVLAMLVVPFVYGDDQPGSHARIVRLSYVEGQAQVSHHIGAGYENATMNVPLVEGDQVRTGNDGWVEIQLENGSMIRLAPESQLTFALLGRFPSGATVTEVNLDEGEAEFSVAAGDEDGPFKVNVRQRTISLKHSSRFRVTTVNSDPLEVAVWKGELGIFNSDTGQEVTVKKHEVFTLDPQDASHYDLEKDAQADELDHWSSERDQYLQSYTANNNNYMQSPYQYGTSDLNYYGQYYSVAGCGYCWQPYGVGLGWDPFMNGYWYGSTWVSAYPWGWMPYRFGQWVFVPGFGWLWQPGLWNRWVPVPRVVNPPAGFRPPVPPAATAATGVDNPRVGNSFDGGPSHLTVNNPALTTNTDKVNKPVISNEHTPLRRIGDLGNSQQPTNTGTANTGTANTGKPVVRVHPPVETRPMRPSVANAPPPPVHVSPPPQVSRPQSFSPPPHFSPPPRSFSPPPPPPAAHSGPHR